MTESDVLERLVSWGEGRPDVRALILTSSRARPGGPVDDLSDYDVIVAVTDPGSFASAGGWQDDFGRPVVRWGDVDEVFGLPTYFRGTIYDDGTKLDLTFWPVELLDRVSAQGEPLDELDAGYRVLLDKDGATADWPEPTYRAYIPARPTEREYRALVEEFWWDATYVAKALQRGQLFFARSFLLEYDVKTQILRRLLEWRTELDHDWSLPVGVYGRGLERTPPPDILHELQHTYGGPGVDESWDDLDRLTALLRRVAVEVGQALAYAYPQDVDDAINALVEGIRALPHAERPGS